MSPFTAFILGTVFGIVTLVVLLAWAVWAVWVPAPTIKRPSLVVTADGKDALLRAIQDDLKTARMQ